MHSQGLTQSSCSVLRGLDIRIGVCSKNEISKVDCLFGRIRTHGSANSDDVNSIGIFGSKGDLSMQRSSSITCMIFIAPAEEMDALDLLRKRLIKDRKEHRPIEVSQREAWFGPKEVIVAVLYSNSWYRIDTAPQRGASENQLGFVLILLLRPLFPKVLYVEIDASLPLTPTDAVLNPSLLGGGEDGP